MLLIEQLSAEEAFVFVNLTENRQEVIFRDKFSSTTHYGQPKEKSIEDRFYELCVSLRVTDPERAQIWLDNLIRLALVEIKAYTDTEFVPVTQHRHGESSASVETKETRDLMFTAFGPCLSGRLHATGRDRQRIARPALLGNVIWPKSL